MIHHAVLGSLGRFIGILLESSEGNLPLWLAPAQVAVMPISDDQLGEAQAAVDGLLSAGIRADLYAQSETLSRRLVMAHEEMVPLQAIIGAREAASGSVALRGPEGQEVLSIEAAIHRLKEMGSPPR